MINSYLESNEHNNHKNLQVTSRIILKDEFIILSAYFLKAK